MEIKTYYSDHRGSVCVPCVELKRIKLGKKIRAHAMGSLYRMNAQSADCYAFNYIYTGLHGKKAIDWDGGWDWKNDLIDKDAEYFMDLSDGKFYKILWTKYNIDSELTDMFGEGGTEEIKQYYHDQKGL